MKLEKGNILTQNYDSKASLIKKAHEISKRYIFSSKNYNRHSRIIRKEKNISRELYKVKRAIDKNIRLLKRNKNIKENQTSFVFEDISNFELEDLLLLDFINSSYDIDNNSQFEDLIIKQDDNIELGI